MIPPVIMQAIKHAAAERRRTDGSDLENALRRQTYRQALAFAFAEVCVKLGIDVEALFKKPDPGPEMAPVRKAILKVLDGN
jgi:hypothetical protein